MTGPIDTIREALDRLEGLANIGRTKTGDEGRAALTEVEHQLADEHVAVVATQAACDIWQGRAEAAEQRANALADALRRVKENAEAWHGPVPEDSGHARALAVIAEWCGAALDRQEQT